MKKTIRVFNYMNNDYKELEDLEKAIRERLTREFRGHTKRLNVNDELIDFLVHIETDHAKVVEREL